ncbi:uncharacterized protein LOC132903567 [Amyelois transitella]|uniref:uncharacterized protein LOC132903567 n=1 Tax=Amyelois transitella TaxID=680683 RepID=UPI00298FA42E|nr:uncharacterized protein LOC132903567 [Amyelois transitella]
MNKQNDSANDDNLSSLLSLEDQGSRFMQKNIDVVERDKPLWSVRQKAYAKFQLKSLQNKMDEDDKNKMMNATTSCHICKITVPLKFMNEHMNSKKHRIYIKIIDEAFQRVKKNINIVSTPQSVNTKSDSTYFCEVCCEAISIIERDIHLKSIDHGKALRYDKVLEGFLIFYEMGSAYFKTEEGNDNSTNDKCEIDEAVENKASVDKETQNISSSGKVLRPCDVDLNENVSRENNMTPLVKIEGTLNNKCAKDSLETVTEENNLTLMNEHIKTQNSNNLSIEFDKTKELKFYVAVLIITFPGVLDIGVINENFVFIISQ